MSAPRSTRRSGSTSVERIGARNERQESESDET